MDMRAKTKFIDEFGKIFRERLVAGPHAFLQLSETGSEQLQAQGITFFARPFRDIEDNEPTYAVRLRERSRLMPDMRPAMAGKTPTILVRCRASYEALGLQSR